MSESFLPFSLILVGNIIMLVSFTRSKRIQSNLTGRKRDDEAKVKSLLYMSLSISLIFLLTISSFTMIKGKDC